MLLQLQSWISHYLHVYDTISIYLSGCVRVDLSFVSSHLSMCICQHCALTNSSCLLFMVCHPASGMQSQRLHPNSAVSLTKCSQQLLLSALSIMTSLAVICNLLAVVAVGSCLSQACLQTAARTKVAIPSSTFDFTCFVTLFMTFFLASFVTPFLSLFVTFFHSLSSIFSHPF